VRIYQPPRPEPLPQLESGAIDESGEWEEAEITATCPCESWVTSLGKG
jgi:hypothetical protein